jgi:putative transposase
MPELFSHRRPQEEKSRDELEAELYRQIGQLKVELEWLKKNLKSSSRAEESRSRA